jgi:signal transduction histidine kinase
LGRELIADPNLAVAEFVKNAYDAGASQVYLDFSLTGTSRQKSCLTISDNGSGMDRKDFLRDWMRPGYSAKSLKGASVPRIHARVKRVPIGEKGLGRLAAGRLGDRLEVFTRKRVGDPWLHVMFDWSAFQNMNIALRAVNIPYDHRTEPPSSRFMTGTILRICDLTIDWSGMIPGRKVPGRSDTRFGRLRQDLEILVAPLHNTRDQFQIILASDVPALAKFLGPVKAGTEGQSDYTYNFSIKRSGQKEIIVEREIRRSDRIQRQIGAKALTPSKEVLAADGPSEGSTDERPASLRSGPFSGVFHYSPRVAKRSLELGMQPGVFLYRDGIRVDPYGHWDDDWLGARARKASRQGYAAIQPNTLYGNVSISKAHNPELIDMSNRQGLVENEAYFDFLAHARAEFRVFEDVVLEEYVKPGWEQPDARAQRAAERAQNVGSVLLRNLVHTIRQPVFGLGADMASLRTVIDTRDLPRVVAEELTDIHGRATNHLRSIDQAVREFLKLDLTAELEALPILGVLKKAVSQVQPLAQSLDVNLEIVRGDDRVVAAPRQALIRAVAEVVRNGIQAPRPKDRLPRWVRLSAGADGSKCVVTVADNGTGISPKVARDLMSKPVSTEGRPGVGLIDVKNILALFRGTVSMVSTNEEGTTFAITIPTIGELRKEA